MSVHSRSNLNLKVLVLKKRGKFSRVPREKPFGARGRTNNRLTHIWRRCQDLDLSHFGGRQVLSPLCHPCSPTATVLDYLTIILFYFGGRTQLPQVGTGRGTTPPSALFEFKLLETFRFKDEYDYEYEIFSILSSACA